MGNVPAGNKIVLNIIGPDKNVNIIDSNMREELYSNENGWQASPNSILTWLLDFSDGTYYGNPLNHGYASLSNKADVYFREYFEIDLQNKTVEKVSSMLGVTPEHWTGGASEENWARLGDIEYEIKNASGAVLRNGVLATKNQIRDQYENLTYYAGDRRFAWYETNLSSPLTLEKDKGYYLELFSPNTTPEPRYTCDAPNIRPWINPAYPNAGPSFLSLTTYDGSSSYFERWDANSGAIWKQDGYQRDVSLKFKLVDVYNGKITSISKDAESIGSAGDVWKQIKYEGSVPSGTSVDIAVNSPSYGGFVTVENNAVSGTTYDLPSCAQERYASWRLVLHTSDSSITPEIDNVTFINGADGDRGTISGTVTSTTGAPIQGATVQTSSYSNTTNSSGEYTITLVVGNYTITASATGYQSQSKPAEVTASKTTPLDFQLVFVDSSHKVIVYPNPYIKGKSNGQKISFVNLPKEAVIKIYNSGGELAKELIAGVEGKAEWNISDLHSGVYLYVVSSPEGVKKGKVSIIK